MFTKYKGEIGLGLTAFYLGKWIYRGFNFFKWWTYTTSDIDNKIFIGAVLLGIIFFKEIKNNITKEAVKSR